MYNLYNSDTIYVKVLMELVYCYTSSKENDFFLHACLCWKIKSCVTTQFQTSKSEVTYGILETAYYISFIYTTWKLLS